MPMKVYEFRDVGRWSSGVYGSRILEFGVEGFYGLYGFRASSFGYRLQGSRLRGYRFLYPKPLNPKPSTQTLNP